MDVGVVEAATALAGDVTSTQADVSRREDCQQMAEDDLDQVLATSLKGTIFAVQACRPALRRSGRGRIIVISSITGPVTGFPGSAHYGASKAAQLGFMRTAAIELAPSGITVSALLPGNFVTEGLAALGEDHITKMAAPIPLRRLGTVDEIGHAALFLATAEAAYAGTWRTSCTIRGPRCCCPFRRRRRSPSC